MNTETIKNIIAGDSHLFRAFYESYVDKALGVAIGMTQNKDLAKDAVQETFIRVYRNLRTYDTTKPFEPWFYRILTNECRRVMKNASKSVLLEREKMENDSRWSEERDDQVEDVREAIQRMEEDVRVPLVLKYIKGFSEKEIATTLGLNQNTVKTRLLKGREQLKNVFQVLEDGRDSNG